MNYRSFARSQATEIHRQWVNTILDIKDSSSITGREMASDFLADLHEQATELSQQYLHHLSPIEAAQISHITSRPLQQHLTVLRTTNRNLVVTH